MGAGASAGSNWAGVLAGSHGLRDSYTPSFATFAASRAAAGGAGGSAPFETSHSAVTAVTAASTPTRLLVTGWFATDDEYYAPGSDSRVLVYQVDRAMCCVSIVVFVLLRRARRL